MSTGRIDDLVSKEALGELDALIEKLGITKTAMATTIEEANKLNSSIGGSKTISEFVDNQTRASEALGKVEKSVEKTRLAEIKLQQAREKAFDDYEKKLSKQAAIEQANLAKISKQRDAEFAKQIKQRQQQEAADKKASEEAVRNKQREDEALKKLAISRRAYNELLQKTRDAVKNAQDIGAAKGTNSIDFKDAQANAAKYQEQLNGINNKLGDYKNQVGNYASGFAKAGKAVGNFLTPIRQLAYILPGIGLAGIFNLAFEAIGALLTNLDLFKEKLTSAKAILDSFNSVNKEANQTYAKESTELKVLYGAATDVNNSMSKRLDAARELQKDWPKTFANFTSEQIITGQVKKGYDDLTLSLYENAKARAALAKIEKLAADNLDAEFEKQKLDRAGAAEKKRVPNLVVERNLGTNSDALMATPKSVLIAQANKEIDDRNEAKKKVQDARIKINNDQIDFLTKMAGGNNELAASLGAGAKQQDLDKRRSDNNAELQKTLLQAQIDTNNAIVDNDKNSYAKRQAALSASIAQQKQLRGLSLNQELNDVTLQADQKAVITAKYNTDIEKLTKDGIAKRRQLQSQSNKDDLALDIQRLENKKKIAEDKTLDPSGDYEGRLDALTEYQTYAKKIIENQEKLEITEAGNNASKLKTAKEKAANSLLDVDNDVAKKRLQIEKEVQAELKKEFDAGIKSLEASLGQEVIDLQDAQNSKLIAIDQFKSEALKGLADQYRDGKIRADEYNQQVYDIDAQAAKDRVDLQIDTISKIIDKRKEDLFFGIGSAKELQKANDDLAKLQIQASDLATKVEIDNIQKLQTAKKELQNLEKEIIVQSIDLIKTLVDTGYQNQLNALQAQSQQIQDNGEAEKTQINSSILSNKEKARETAIVDAQTAQSQKQIAQQEKQIKIEQAKFDKLASIAKILAATAVAEVQALVYLSNPFTAPLYPAIAGLIAGLGAVQLAAVVATPLPQFFKGTKNAPEGLAHVGERGTELQINPDGSMGLTPNTDTITYLKKGTQIIPHHELMAMFAKPEQINYVGGTFVDNKKLEKLMQESNDLKRREKRTTVVKIMGDKFGTYANRNY